MAHAQVLIPQRWGTWDRIEAPGRPSGRTAGGWMADLAALRKFVTLCDFCQAKWAPGRHGYMLWRKYLPTGPYVSATCDGCQSKMLRCKAWIHESFHPELGEDGPRRRGRWARTTSDPGYLAGLGSARRNGTP